MRVNYFSPSQILLYYKALICFYGNNANDKRIHFGYADALL